MSDTWKAFPIKCDGGLILNSDILTQSKQYPGSALVLQNFECALEGGYKRILGYTKWDTNVVPGTTNAPVLGVLPALGGVIANRFNSGTGDNSVYFSVGNGWTKINTSTRTSAVTKMRGISSYITTPAVIIVDGVHYAAKWDGTTWTDINGTGAPLGAKYAAIFTNALVLAGYGSSQEISISEPNSDTLFDGTAGAISIPISDKIMGIRTFRDELYIYCENSIKKLTGTDITTYAIVDVTNSIGCVANDSIQELGGDLIFLSPDGFRSTAATSRIGDVELGLVSRQIQTIVRSEIGKNDSDDKYSSLVIRGKSQYRAFFNDGDTMENGQIGFLGCLQEREDPLGTLQYNWSTLMGIKPYCAASAYTNNQEIAVFGHPTSGFVYRLEEGVSFDGNAITSIYRSPDLVFDSDVLRKVIQKATIYTQLEGDATVTFKVYLDRNSSIIPQPSPQLLTQTGSFSTYGTAIYGSSTYGNLTYPLFKLQTVGAGFTAAFEFSSTDTNPPYRIDDFTITYALKAYR